jgi:hypothetical protein
VKENPMAEIEPTRVFGGGKIELHVKFDMTEEDDKVLDAWYDLMSSKFNEHVELIKAAYILRGWPAPEFGAFLERKERSRMAYEPQLNEAQVTFQDDVAAAIGECFLMGMSEERLLGITLQELLIIRRA